MDLAGQVADGTGWSEDGILESSCLVEAFGFAVSKEILENLASWKMGWNKKFEERVLFFWLHPGVVFLASSSRFLNFRNFSNFSRPGLVHLIFVVVGDVLVGEVVLV